MTDIHPDTPGAHRPPYRLQLRPPAHLVSRKAIGYWTLRAVPGWLVVAVIEVVMGFVSESFFRPLLPVLLPVTALVAITHLAVMPSWRYRVHRWETSADAVYTQAGWFNQRWRVAPISRIQTVDTVRGPLEQLFGLAKVTITTASSAGAVEVAGLDVTTAARLVDELTERTQANREDAT